MSEFTNWDGLHLHTETDTEGRWKLDKALHWHVGGLESDFVVTVPVGFETDLASVPRFLWPIVPPFGFHSAPAVLHDWLYSVRLRDRAWADRQFYDAMLACDVPKHRAQAMWLAVRLFGFRRYNRR